MDNFDSVRVLTKVETREAVGLSDRTWDRLERRGEGPPKTQISPNRIGYRLVDIREWLDRRRRAEDFTPNTRRPPREWLIDSFKKFLLPKTAPAQRSR